MWDGGQSHQVPSYRFPDSNFAALWNNGYISTSVTKMKGKGEMAFGEVTGRVPEVERGRAREGLALLLSEWMVNKGSGMEGSVFEADVGKG